MYARASCGSDAFDSARSSLAAAAMSAPPSTRRTATLTPRTSCAGYAVDDVTTAAATTAAAMTTVTRTAPCARDRVTAALDTASPSSLRELRARSLFAFGLRDTAGLLDHIAQLLALLRRRVGRREAVVAAFRLPRTPPRGVTRPVYDTAVLLIVLDSATAATQLTHGGDAGRLHLRDVCALRRHRRRDGGDGGCDEDDGGGGDVVVSLREAREVALRSDAAERCLRTFACTTTSSSLSPSLYTSSARLWTAVLSSVSTYAVDWAAARAAAARGDAVVIDEREVLLAYALDNSSTSPCGRDGVAAAFGSTLSRRVYEDDDGARDGVGAARARMSGSDGRRYAQRRDGSRDRGLLWCNNNNSYSGNSTSARTTTMTTAAETVQHRYYRERYGVRDVDMSCRDGAYGDSARGVYAHVTTALWWLWRVLVGPLDGRESDDDDDDGNGDNGGNGAPPRQRRRLDDDNGSDNGDGTRQQQQQQRQTRHDREDDDSSGGDDDALAQLPRLGSIAASLISLPGFRYVLPLLQQRQPPPQRSADDTTMTTTTSSSSSRAVAWDEATLARRFAPTTTATMAADGNDKSSSGSCDSSAYHMASWLPSTTPTTAATATASTTAHTSTTTTAADDTSSSSSLSRSASRSLQSLAAPLRQWLSRRRVHKRTRSGGGERDCMTAATASSSRHTTGAATAAAVAADDAAHMTPRTFVFGSHDVRRRTDAPSRNRRGASSHARRALPTHDGAEAAASSSSSSATRLRAPTRIRVLSVVSHDDSHATSALSLSPSPSQPPRTAQRTRTVNFRLPDEQA